LGLDAYCHNLCPLILKKADLINLLIVVSLIVTRFLGLAWGNGFFFHPDENNMAWAVERITWPRLNPEFFAYGHIPLYLAYFSYQLIKFVLFGPGFNQVPFSQAVYLLRFWSGVFSLLTVLIGWFLARELFGEKRWSQVFASLLIFTPGLIQMAHFGTTESILTFSALSLAYFSIKFFRTGKRKYLVFLSLISSLALATKVSGVLFLPAPIFVIFLKKGRVRNLLLFSGMTLFLATVFSPYNVINFREFVRIVQYEADVARGRIPVFYTRQFINTQPFIFQVTKILPWTLGTPLFFLTVLALIRGLAGFLAKPKLKTYWLVLHFTWLPWLVFNIFLFAKWTRFTTPILPFLVLIALYFLRELERKKPFSFVVIPLLFLTIIPGLVFVKLYLSPDIRVKASWWINSHLPENSVILSEEGNVVNLPLFNDKNLEIENFDFYHLDENPDLKERLENLVRRADYILLPSRRLFANHWRLPDQFPLTADFYRKLFSGELGFIPIKEFKVFSFGEQLLLGSDLTSEETWTAFDHPTIRLFIRRQ